MGVFQIGAKLEVPHLWMVLNGKSYYDGLFRGTPILGNHHMPMHIHGSNFCLIPQPWDRLRCKKLHTNLKI